MEEDLHKEYEDVNDYNKKAQCFINSHPKLSAYIWK